MEAFLLMLDVFAVVWLCFAVWRGEKAEGVAAAADMRMFSYPPQEPPQTDARLDPE